MSAADNCTFIWKYKKIFSDQWKGKKGFCHNKFNFLFVIQRKRRSYCLVNSQECSEETPHWCHSDWDHYFRICFTLTMPLHGVFMTLDRAVDHRARFRAQHQPATGGRSFPAGSPEQGAETQAARAWGNHQVQVQILYQHPGGQDCSAGRTAGHRVKVSANAMDKLLWSVSNKLGWCFRVMTSISALFSLIALKLDYFGNSCFIFNVQRLCTDPLWHLPPLISGSVNRPPGWLGGQRRSWKRWCYRLMTRGATPSNTKTK